MIDFFSKNITLDSTETCGESNEVFFSVNTVDCLDAFQK